MSRFIIALGSSHYLGKKYIDRAQNKILDRRLGRVMGSSLIHQNAATMTSYNSMFYNAALALTSSLHPICLYRELYAIELELGRIRPYKNARRTIDIDIVLSLDMTYNNDYFFLPHKEVYKRVFFILPTLAVLKQVAWPIPYSLLKARSMCTWLFFKS